MILQEYTSTSMPYTIVYPAVHYIPGDYDINDAYNAVGSWMDCDI